MGDRNGKKSSFNSVYTVYLYLARKDDFDKLEFIITRLDYNNLGQKVRQQDQIACTK